LGFFCLFISWSEHLSLSNIDAANSRLVKINAFFKNLLIILLIILIIIKILIFITQMIIFLIFTLLIIIKIVIFIT
jgi:hypothetical protein